MSQLTKKVYLYSLTGLYTGSTDHPVSQALPERSTVTPPPAHNPLLPYMVYVGGGWVAQDTLPVGNVYDKQWDFGWAITTNAFAQRFTFSEQIEIEKAKDGVGVYANSPYVYPLKALMAALARATYSDLLDQQYADAMQLLYAIGILTSARVNVIVNTKATWKELPQWRQAEMIAKGYVPQ